MVLSLKHSALPETVETQTAWIGLDATQNDMVVQVDIDCFGSLAELTGDLHIGAAWRGIATGMVVHADDGGGSVANRFAENFPRVGETVRRGAGTDLHLLDQAIFAIQAEHPEFLHLKPGQLGGEVGEHQDGFLEGNLGRLLLFQHATGHFQHRDQLQGFHSANSFQASKILLRPRNQAGERTGFGDESLRHDEDIVSFAAAAQEHGQQFRIAEGGGPMFFEAFLRAFADGEIF